MPERPPATVGVDARLISSSGIGRYLRGVLDTLLRDERFARVTLLGAPRELEEFLGGRRAAGEVRVAEYGGEVYSARSQLHWLRLRGRVDAGVWFFPHFDAPFFHHPRRSVVTVHDLTHFRVPEAFSPRLLPLAGLLLDRVTARAGRVLTVSESTRRDLVARRPALAEKIQVIHNGISPVFRPAAPGEPPPPERLLAAKPFLLCVGNRKPHKNLLAAVETLAAVRKDRPELRLVMAGGQANNGWQAVLERAQELGVGEALVDAGQVSDAELRQLYLHCEALLFPSFYEGFGFPAVEAMACGAPVVASNRASLPEIVGDAGLLVEPNDVAGMVAAVQRLAGEPGLRAGLVRRGLQRAAEFDEEAAARRTADALLATAQGLPLAVPTRREAGASSVGAVRNA